MRKAPCLDIPHLQWAGAPRPHLRLQFSRRAYKIREPDDRYFTAISLQHGDWRMTVSCGGTAIDAELQQAFALHSRGQLLAAQAIYERILQRQPQHFDALHMLGVMAAQSGNPTRAVAIISSALAIVPNDAVAHKNRAAALQELGHWDAALAGFERAAMLDPGYAEAHYCRGNLYYNRKRWADAVACYDQAIAIRSGYAEALCNRGACQLQLLRWDDALASYDLAISIKPDFVEVFYNRGNVLCRLRRWQDALQSFDRAIALRPDYAVAYADRAFALQELACHAEALASCDRALALDPLSAEGHINRAGILMSLNLTNEAVAGYDHALALNPTNASAYVNRGMARLAMGDFLGGWADYEWRWKDPTGWVMLEDRHFPQKQWHGESTLSGKTVLLHAEQGYGDTLQFCRFAKPVAELGARVVLEAPPALATLLRDLDGVSQLVMRGEALPAFDYYCPLLSLPLAMRTELQTIPATVPYLQVSEQLRALWRSRLGSRLRPRVGLAWSGGFRLERPELWSVNQRRNVPLEAMVALSSCDVDFYSLQVGESADKQLAALTAQRWSGPIIKNESQYIRDFADTAALISEMDLVISVDTAIAHLAGALGKPVWILNRFDACWRWLRNRADSPWYPTARLYRQMRPGDWTSVLEHVSADLHKFVGAQSLCQAD